MSMIGPDQPCCEAAKNMGAILYRCWKSTLWAAPMATWNTFITYITGLVAYALEVTTVSTASARKRARGSAATHGERGLLYTSYRASESMRLIDHEQPCCDAVKIPRFLRVARKNKTSWLRVVQSSLKRYKTRLSATLRSFLERTLKLRPASGVWAEACARAVFASGLTHSLRAV